MKGLSSGSRDSHVSRDTRELLGDHGSTFIALSIDTIGLALRLLVAEKSLFELCQNRLKRRYQPSSKSNISKTKPKFKNPA